MIGACTLAIAYPLWIGIFVNLAMTAYNISHIGSSRRSRFSDWYFDRSGGPKLMAGVWITLLAWSALNGARVCSL